MNSRRSSIEVASLEVSLLSELNLFLKVYYTFDVLTESNAPATAGVKPGMEVSWQVTGIRQDVYARDHRIAVEEGKGKESGYYLYPAGFGEPREKSIEYALNPALAQPPREGENGRFRVRESLGKLRRSAFSGETKTAWRAGSFEELWRSRLPKLRDKAS